MVRGMMLLLIMLLLGLVQRCLAVLQHLLQALTLLLVLDYSLLLLTPQASPAHKKGCHGKHKRVLVQQMR
jgi:uncharacterized membrane protein YkgB